MRHLGGCRWAGQDRDQGWTAEDFISSLDGTPWRLVGIWVHATQPGRDVVVRIRRVGEVRGELMRSRGQIWGALSDEQAVIARVAREHEGYLQWTGYRPRGTRARCAHVASLIRHRMHSGRTYLHATGR